MDHDPLLSIKEALTTDELKLHMYQSALLLLMSDQSNTHEFAYEKLQEQDSSVPYIRHSVDRVIDTAEDASYDDLQKHGVKTVKISYKPDANNRLESVDGETVIMEVRNSDGTDHILKMRIENSGHLEEIEATATTRIVDGAYVSGDASQFDLEQMQRIAEAIEVADS